MKEGKEFKVNEYITLKLEYGKTYIYIKGERFDQCKFLLLNMNVDDITSLDEIESIDEAAEKLDENMEVSEYTSTEIQIPPDVEFWGHCSNLQVWAENDYDTRLLHSNLAFPLLEELTEAGDPLAKKIFKEEIAKRIQTKYLPVVQYLKEAGYLFYLNDEEKEIAFSDYDKVIVDREVVPVLGFELDLSHKGINSILQIKGLENCINLKELNLSQNNIKKIEGIENLTELVELNLWENQIEKIEGLKTLTKLRKLLIDRNQIKKVQGFGLLVNLQELSLTKNKITKIEDLQNCINLKSLALSDNNVTKIEGFEHLINLELLYLSGNSIKKIEGLDKNINLKQLFLNNNNISKIECLDRLLILNFLSLENNHIKKIEGLEMLTQLDWLKLGRNLIQRIENVL